MKSFVPETSLCRTGDRLASSDLHAEFDRCDDAVYDLIDAPDRLALGGCGGLETQSMVFATSYVIRDGWLMRPPPAERIAPLPPPIGDAPTRAANPASAALVRKLHRWELQHLREHVEELRAELDKVTAERDDALRSLSYAEYLAESWRDDALRAIEDSGAAPGLTTEGHLVAVSPATQSRAS